ncbi:purine-nucleoside phosphorylase [Singulisphaera sp. GP187]|uniref:purine-nucleoside phosphorylase n=1 Tax=Singulisphaera sp. GP187 TaxID=1882752 RepID=UPI00092857A8|nr:purine-nucleoside phosphorylase [Singulisphaera sp. GP187]SIO65399.1 purine-nucleoside phosphorylase [Singulisphaera sp. GP187]
MPPIELDARASEAARVIRATLPEPPQVALVLGSGLGALADRLADRVVIPYAQIPHFPRPTVEGHEGNLVAGSIGGSPLLVLQGRFHYYEGYDLDEVTFPIRVLQRLGVRTLILTAATGGIALSLQAGSIVCLEDHLNLIGANPLRGPNDRRLGARFPDMSEVYSRRLRTFAYEEASQLGLDLASGVYACLPGPSYETPAEIRMLRTLGADVVGMSTVPEAIVARHAGLDVLAFAVVTNAAAGVSGGLISHVEVVEAGQAATPRLGALIERFVQRLDAEARPLPQQQ